MDIKPNVQPESLDSQEEVVTNFYFFSPNESTTSEREELKG